MIKRIVLTIWWMLVACVAPVPPKITHCPSQLAVSVNGQPVPDQVPNPFQGLPNPEISNPGEELRISLNTEETGLIELLGLNTKLLQTGTLEGSQFQLTLSYSPNYQHCNSSQKDSQLVIEDYHSKQLAGCFYGKFACEGKTVEVIAPFAGPWP